MTRISLLDKSGGPSAARRRAFTLVETVICLVVTSLMLVAALSAVSSARVGLYSITERQRGELLAQQLMSEILTQAYREPDDAPVFGLEGAEMATQRGAWDDLDDYLSWSASPPQYKDGSEMPGLDGWTRAAEVKWVSPSNLKLVGATETGVKRITVTVRHNGKPVATLIALRTDDS